MLLCCGLYYGVLIFNLSITFWIGEGLLGTTGVFIYLPVTVLLALRLFRYLPAKAEQERLLRLPVESYSIYKYLNHRLGRYNAARGNLVSIVKKSEQSIK